MTDPPQGRDQSPAVAALAVRVDGLRRRIETLATSIDDLTSTQQEHATVLDGITELRRQVEQILAMEIPDFGAHLALCDQQVPMPALM